MKKAKKSTASGLNQPLSARRKRRWQAFSLFKIGTIFQWTLAIFFIVTLPLILTLLYSVWSIQDYTERGADLFLTIEVSNNSQALVDQLQDLERSIRQYQILEGSELFTVFQRHHHAFLKLSRQTSFYDLPGQFQSTLTQLTQDETDLYAQIVNKKKTGSESLSTEDIKGYVQLRADARQLVRQGNRQITLETEALSTQAALVREQVALAALVSVILVFILGPILLYLINKPIKRIEWAIRNLGNEQFNKHIDIEGPRDLREIGHYLEWLRTRLNKLENSKQFFIKTISHELKTPLASLMEGADLLQDEVVGELNAEQHKIIELLQIANISLNSLIENLLEYQKATSTLAKVNYSQFDLRQVIGHICADYQLLLDRKQVVINMEGEKIDLMADRDKIRIIVSNLFSNALKFSPDGGQILIKLEVNGAWLQLLIADQGPGIAENQKPHVFTEFYQQETPENWKIKGSGLGLSLVKGYVTAHHGRVSLLESDDYYCGAHFLIQLPLLPQKNTSDNN